MATTPTVLTTTDWDIIHNAVEQIAAGAFKRLDGKGWTVHAVGVAIRIDIKRSAGGA